MSKKHRSKEERLALIARAKRGDDVAFNAYAKMNEGLLHYLIRVYTKDLPSPADEQDLMQEALLGLRKGVDSFRLDKNATSGKPEGYIFSWVRAYVSRYVKKYGISKYKNLVVPTTTLEANATLDALSNIPSQDLSPSQVVEYNDTYVKIRTFVRSLPWKKRVVAEYRLIEYPPIKSLRDIGNLLGVSHERVRQIEIDVKCDLLKYMVAEQLV